MIETQETEVLIIGAGSVGLALAIELGTRGVRCMVIEQNDRVGKNPRAKTTMSAHASICAAGASPRTCAAPPGCRPITPLTSSSPRD